MWLIEPESSDGDLNTGFFHAAALAHRKVHTIKSLLESNDVIVDKEEEIQKVTWITLVICLNARTQFGPLLYPPCIDV